MKIEQERKRMMGEEGREEKRKIDQKEEYSIRYNSSICMYNI